MSNLKPFDLNRALAGDPVVNGSGKKIKKIVYVPEVDDPYYKLFVVLEDGDFYHTSDTGQYSTGSSRRDLYMATKKAKYYFASWPSLNMRGTTCMYADKAYLQSLGFVPDSAIYHEIEIEE